MKEDPRLFSLVGISAKNAAKLREKIADPETDPAQQRLMRALLEAYETRHDHGK